MSQGTIYDGQKLALVVQALAFYAEEATYRPVLGEMGDTKVRRPCLRDRGAQAREALALLEDRAFEKET